jgi:NTE family protein
MPQADKDAMVALVFQGGGALGAYQAGVYEALAESGCVPQWIAGISIGAINAALIAGNPPERRGARLRAFWDRVSSRVTASSLFAEGPMRSWFNEASAGIAAATGIPGFFEPRFPPAPLWPQGTPEAISLYDTAPLRATLLELVDFDLINARKVRLSVGAVNVLTGNFVYFDNKDRVIGPEHIMASGALPPGFPPVVIDGEPYWDGGIVSNTPLQYVLDECTGPDMTIFQVDLFSARGTLPRTLADAAQREKDIRFSSRTRLNTDMQKELQRLHDAAARLAQKLPPELRDDPDARLLANHFHDRKVAVMHLINRSEAYETSSKDYEFSRQTVNGHWDSGRTDVLRSLSDRRWTHRHRHGSGLHTFDLAGDNT